MSALRYRPLKKKFQKKIDVGASYIWLPANIFLEDLSIIDEGGRLYHCKTFNLKYNLADLLFGKREFFFNLNGIRLYRHAGLLDSVADMLVIAKMPDVELEEIKGSLELHKNGAFIKNLYTHNDKMRINGNGWISRDGLLDCDVNFSFSKDITDKIPDAVKVALLRDEDEGWMGIALKVKGSYKKPSLHITANTIKLNILQGLLGDD